MQLTAATAVNATAAANAAAANAAHECRYEIASYRAAEKIAGASSPHECILVDDSWGNMKAAKQAGWTTVLCGRKSRDGKDAMQCADADFVIGSILELPTVLPYLFQ